MKSIANTAPAYEAPHGRILGTVTSLTESKNGHTEFDSHKGAHHKQIWGS